MKKGKNKDIIIASWVAIGGNALLAALKIIVGFTAGSLAVIGDGIDSSTDILTSAITLVTAIIIAKPPTAKHPFGYHKADNIAAKVLSFIIFFAGGQLAFSTVKQMITGAEASPPEMLAIHVTIFSILMKLALGFYLRKQGKKNHSQMLIANAKNMQNDVIISVSVLVGLAFTIFLKLPIIDSITALLVSIWIFKTAIEIFLDSNVELMDGVKDDTVYEKIINAASSVTGVKNPHRVRSRQIGGLYMIDIDIEVDGNITVCEAHVIATNVEYKIKKEVENVYDIMVHVEPYGYDHDPEEFGISANDL